MQAQRPSYNNNPSSPKVLERNPSGKISYSPGHWKNYIANDLMRKPEQSRSSYQSGPRVNAPINNSYLQQVGHVTQRQEKEKKKEQMLKRVKLIQERVMPLIQNDCNNKQDDDFSFKSKMQQKVAKLQTAVDAMQKNLEIKLEKQILQLEKKMQQKYNELQNKLMKNKQIEM